MPAAVQTVDFMGTLPRLDGVSMPVDVGAAEAADRVGPWVGVAIIRNTPKPA